MVAGVPIAAGDYLCMLYASGNRDERVFGEDAARFDVRRPANPMHVAFGFGEHVCLGASLARLEARIFVEELLGRFPRYEVTGTAERVRSTTVAGIRSLPVVLAPDGLSAVGSLQHRLAQLVEQQLDRGGVGAQPQPSVLALRAHQAVLPQHLDVHAHRGLGQTEEHAPARPRCSARSPGSAGGPDGWDRPPP